MQFADLYPAPPEHRREEPTARDFLARVSFDGVILKKHMVRHLESGCYIGKCLRWCMELKPDTKWLGFVPLSEEDFQKGKWKGSCAKYLHHIFEKHQGETIKMAVKKGELVADPKEVTMHNAQFYVDAHENGPQLRAYEESTRFHQRRNDRSEYDIRQFLYRMVAIPNTVYHPGPGGQGCHTVQVTYHSLPSLVWECCGSFKLHDIYTFFCQTDRLTSAQPHSSAGRGGRGGRK